MDKRPDWTKSYSREFRFEDAFELTGISSLGYYVTGWSGPGVRQHVYLWQLQCHIWSIPTEKVPTTMARGAAREGLRWHLCCVTVHPTVENLLLYLRFTINIEGLELFIIAFIIEEEQEKNRDK